MAGNEFLNRALALLGVRRRPAGQITVEQLQHMFDYSIRFNAKGRGSSPLGEITKLGTSITFEPVSRDIDLRRARPPNRRDDIVRNPPYLQWAWSPIFAYVGLVGGRVEYRYSTAGELWRAAPTARDREQVAAIDLMFALWYRHLGLPDSLREPTRSERTAQQRAAVAGKDRLALIRHYLSTGDSTFLFDVVGAEDDILLWVDWGEEDDAIVHNVEAILRTGALSARFADVGDTPDLIVTWRGVDIPVSYPAGHADRDTTLIALNRLLQPDCELRLCTASRGSDTLAFLPLPADTWRDLDRHYPQEVAGLFTRIDRNTVLFGA